MVHRIAIEWFLRRKPGDVNPVLLILSKNSHRIREGFSATTEHLIISNLTQCIEDGWYSKQWNATLYVMFCSPHLPAEDLRRMCKMLSLSYSLLASTTMNTLERKLYRYAGLALAVIAISLSSICLKVNNNIHSVAWIWTRISMSSIPTIYPSRRPWSLNQYSRMLLPEAYRRLQTLAAFLWHTIHLT